LVLRNFFTQRISPAAGNINKVRILVLDHLSYEPTCIEWKFVVLSYIHSVFIKHSAYYLTNFDYCGLVFRGIKMKWVTTTQYAITYVVG